MQLIRLFEAFFKALGYEGLCGAVEEISLNTNADFFHNMLLDTDEAVYLTALYDFLLREHVVNLAQAILRLLHIPFEHPYQIINVVDPPMQSYIIDDPEDK
jgi:hypothetical protein